MNKNTLLNQNQICSIGADGVHSIMGAMQSLLFIRSVTVFSKDAVDNLPIASGVS